MKIVNLVQGSAEWHEHRRTHRNASETPIVLGVSP
jgi:predicted phage-related endonuclease